MLIIDKIKDTIKNIVPEEDRDIIFRGQLSWILVPILLIILFIFPQYHNIFTITIISIIVVGFFEAIFFVPITNTTKFYSICLHLILLIPIFYNKIFKNIYKNPKKSCIIKNKSERKTKNVRFSNNNKNYYRNDFRYLVKFNTRNFILQILSILTIIVLPFWPYYMSRQIMIIIIIITTIFLWLYGAYF